MLTIAGLWIYPVKSLGGMAVEHARLTAEGSLLGDREWLVVDPAGQMQWQGDLPRMTLLHAALQAGQLTITAPGGAQVSLPAAHEGPERQVFQYGNAFEGVDAGDAAAALLSDWLSAPLRLVRIGAAAHQWPRVNLLHVLSDASLGALNARLQAKGAARVGIMRFRPNVFLEGASVPFEEELRPEIDFGAARILLHKPATRCELVNISLADARREREPLRTIAAMSRERTTGLRGSFGTYAEVRGEGLALGMRERAAPQGAGAMR